MRSKYGAGDKLRSFFGLPPKSREPSPGPSVRAASVAEMSTPADAPHEPPPPPATANVTSDRVPRQRPSRSSVSSSHHAIEASVDNTTTTAQDTTVLAPPPPVIIRSASPATTASASGVADTTRPPETEKAPPSMWQKALHSLKKTPEHQVLTETGVKEDLHQITTSIVDITARIKKEKEGKEWKITFGDDKIVMKDIAMKVLRWVHKFREIGDIIIQFDPVHAALPWAGFRFLLKVNMCCHPL